MRSWSYYDDPGNFKTNTGLSLETILTVFSKVECIEKSSDMEYLSVTQCLTDIAHYLFENNGRNFDLDSLKITLRDSSLKIKSNMDNFEIQVTNIRLNQLLIVLGFGNEDLLEIEDKMLYFVKCALAFLRYED